MLNLQHLKDLESKATKGHWVSLRTEVEMPNGLVVGTSENNSGFLYTLRNAFPDLVEEIERLRAENREVVFLRDENKRVAVAIDYLNKGSETSRAREAKWREFAKAVENGFLNQKEGSETFKQFEQRIAQLLKLKPE